MSKFWNNNNQKLIIAHALTYLWHSWSGVVSTKEWKILCFVLGSAFVSQQSLTFILLVWTKWASQIPVLSHCACCQCVKLGVTWGMALLSTSPIGYDKLTSQQLIILGTTQEGHPLPFLPALACHKKKKSFWGKRFDIVWITWFKSEEMSVQDS